LKCHSLTQPQREYATPKQLGMMRALANGQTDAHKYLRWAAEQIAKRIWWDNREPK
jgi:hypothetical protein